MNQVRRKLFLLKLKTIICIKRPSLRNISSKIHSVRESRIGSRLSVICNGTYETGWTARPEKPKNFFFLGMRLILNLRGHLKWRHANLSIFEPPMSRFCALGIMPCSYPLLPLCTMSFMKGPLGIVVANSPNGSTLVYSASNPGSNSCKREHMGGLNRTFSLALHF